MPNGYLKSSDAKKKKKSEVNSRGYLVAGLEYRCRCISQIFSREIPSDIIANFRNYQYSTAGYRLFNVPSCE